MPKQKFETQDSLFKEVVIRNNSSGELKTQTTVELNSYDSSTMPNYKQGSKVYTGYTCKIATLKPDKDNPRNRIDIDPTDKDVRNAIFKMYEAVDKLTSSE